MVVVVPGSECRGDGCILVEGGSGEDGCCIGHDGDDSSDCGGGDSSDCGSGERVGDDYNGREKTKCCGIFRGSNRVA